MGNSWPIHGNSCEKGSVWVLASAGASEAAADTDAGTTTTTIAATFAKGTATGEGAELVACLEAAHEVEVVDDAEHAVGVDGVGPGVTPLRSGDAAADVAALTQNVIPLEGDIEAAVAEKSLLEL